MLKRRHRGHRRARRAAEEALRDSERRHRIALQHLPGTSVGLYDLDLRCLLLEGPHLERAGIDGAAMVGRHVSEIVSAELLAATEQIVSDSLAGQDGSVEIKSSLTGRTIVIQSAPVRTHDGTIEGIVVVSRDVTEQRLAERAGREAERRFEIAFDRAPIGMALIGVGGSVERVNAALTGITGRSAEELAALRHEELLHPDDEDIAAEAFASLLADDGMATELRIVHADGHPVWVSLRATIVRDDDGTPVHVLVQVQDVTERRSLEDQLRHLADHDALTGPAQPPRHRPRAGPARRARPPLRRRGRAARARPRRLQDGQRHASATPRATSSSSPAPARCRTACARPTSSGASGGDEFAVLLPAEGEAEAIIVAEAIVDGHPRGHRRHRVGRRDAVRRRADDDQRAGPGRHGDVRRQAGRARPLRVHARPAARDGLRRAAPSPLACAPMAIVPEIFKAYDIRGLHGEQLDADGAEQIGRAFVRVLAGLAGKAPGELRIGLGRDMRLTAPELSARYRAGMVAEGAHVLDAGMVGTEMLYFLVGSRGLDGGLDVHRVAQPEGLHGGQARARGRAAAQRRRGHPRHPPRHRGRPRRAPNGRRVVRGRRRRAPTSTRPPCASSTRPTSRR